MFTVLIINYVKILFTVSRMKMISKTGLEIDISMQCTIEPPALEIWWSCQISGGPDVANFQWVL